MGAAGAREGHGRPHRPQRRGSRPEEGKRGRPPLDRASLARSEWCPTRKKPVFRTTNACRRARWKQNWEEMIRKERQWLILDTQHSDKGSVSGDVGGTGQEGETTWEDMQAPSCLHPPQKGHGTGAWVFKPKHFQLRGPKSCCHQYRLYKIL